MTAEPDAIHYRRLRAPRDDGAALIDPPLVVARDWLQQSAALAGQGVSSSLLAENAQRAASYDCQGRWLTELSQSARLALLSRAVDYTRGYRDLDLPPVEQLAQQPLILAGHQPTLFHPGVWFKNFALSNLARLAGGTAVNLVVDNDTLRAATIRVPAGSVAAPLLENVPFDDASTEMPFEERRLKSADVFDSFAERTCATLQPFIDQSRLASYTPLVRRLGRCAQQARRRQPGDVPLGWLVAEGRHRLEGELGLATLELPLSQLADTDEFRWFVAHLLAELPRFRQVYNEALADYREANGVRSRSHPVPDLAVDDDWLEAPLWIWSTAQPQRRHLFARHCRGGVELSDRHGFQMKLSASGASSGQSVVEQLASLRAQGIKIRPRAIITTMFSRLILSDLFLHGIGGAKYDELTDAIIRRFWDFSPPLYLTLTATTLLPIARPQLTVDDLRRHQRQLRELDYHPELFAADVPEAGREAFARVVAHKQDLLERGWPADKKRAWHRELAACNAQLGAKLAAVRRRLEVTAPELSEQLLTAQRLGSREFSFCLFPEETLPEQLRKLSALPL